MSYCPNKSSQEWKDLVSKVGENKAYLEWFLGSIREQKSDLEIDEDVQFKKTTDPKLMKILRQYNYDQSGFFKYQVNKFQLETILKNAGYDFQVMKSQYGSPYLASNGKFLKVSFNRSESEASDEISEAAASTLVKALSDKLGIKYNFVTKAQARDLLEAEGKVYNDESAFYYRGQTYFTEFNLDDSIHEFSHPLFDALESVNPRLLWTLISSILETDEGKAINKEVASLYKEDFTDGVPSIRALKEIGVRALTAAAKKNINPETGKPFLAAIKRLFLAFKQALRDIFGKDIKISELNENTTLQQLADMLTIGKGKLDLTSLNIKPGVQELFDSNPELANAVYEALGFKERNQVGENPFNTVVNFDLNKIRAVSGKLGEQGATPDGIRNLLKYVGVDLTNVNTDSTKAMADYLRSNPSERNKVLELVKKEPIKLSQLPDGSYDLKDGNHRSTILYYSGIESIPAIITNNTGVVKTTEEYTGPFGGVSPAQEIVTPQQKQQALQLYSQYLDSVFPDSKVKDIVYHGTPNTEIESFLSPEKEGYKKQETTTTGVGGIYFTDVKAIADVYQDFQKKGIKGKTYAALINMKKPIVVAEKATDGITEGFGKTALWNIQKGTLEGLKKANVDGIRTGEYARKTNVMGENNEFAVFEPEQIHILGSKQDIEGFKKFTKNEAQETEDVQFKKKDVYDETSEEEQAYYVEQVNSYKERTGSEPSKKMKLTVEKLLYLKNRVKLINGEYIDVETGEKLKRVSEVLEEDDFFKFEGDESLYDNNREWGNQIDHILRSVLLGKTLEEAVDLLYADIAERNPDGSDVSLSDDVISELYNKFTEFKELYPDSIILTQQIVYNEEKKVAGTIDVVIVMPDGKVKFVDLKSSVNPTNYENGKFGEYETSSGFKNAYNRRFKKKDENGDTVYKASKKDRHEAQLSIYKGLAISKGLQFVDEDALEILPVHITEEDGVNIEEVNVENMFPISSQKEFVEDYWSDSEYDETSDLINNPKYGTFVDKILTILEERLTILKKRHTGTNKFEKSQIENLQKAIATVDKSEVLSKFVNQIFDLFVVNQKTKFPGLLTRMQSTIKKVEDNELSGIEAINELQYFRETTDLYESIVEDLSNFYEDELMEMKDPIEGSAIWKLQKINKSVKRIKSQYKDSINPLIAAELSQYVSASANKSLAEDVAKKQLRVDNYRSIGRPGSIKQAEKLEKEIAKIKSKFKGGITYDTILNELNSGSDVDLGMIDTWISPAISSSNSIVALFAKLVKDKFEDVRMLTFEFANIAANEFEKYKLTRSGLLKTDNVAEFNRGIYERISVRKKNEEGEWVWDDKMSFTQEIDVTKYQKALADATDIANEIRKTKGEKGEKEARDYMKNWYYKNTELKEDFIIDGFVVSKGVEKLIEEKRKLVEDKIWQKWDFDNWLARNYYVDETGDEIYMREFAQPRKSLYSNQNFIDLKSDKSKFDYYKFLVKQYFTDQFERVPFESRLGYILPSIHKTALDKTIDQGIVARVKFGFRKATQKTEADDEIFGEEQISSKFKIVPLLFHNNMPADDVSLDLISSIMLYHEATLKYEAQSSLIGMSDSTLIAMKDAGVFKTDSSSVKLINAAAKKAGIEGMNKYLKKHDGNHIAALLEGFIDMQIYGKTQIQSEISVFGKKFELGKSINSFMSLASFTQIGGNPLLSVANYLTATSNATIEAAGSEFFGHGEYQKSRLIYDKHALNGDFLSDFSSPIHKSLIGQIIDLYDPMQGKYKDKYGRKVSHSTARKMFSSDTWFFMQQQGEHNVQVRTMIAMMLRSKAIKDGKEIDLIDAYELGIDGKIKLIDGVTIPGTLSKNGLVNKDVQNSLHAINKRMHGVYDEFNKTLVEREWWGRLLLMYRKFVVPGYKRRFKAYGIDQEAGLLTEGYQIAFWKLMISETKELMKEFSPFHESNLSPLESSNAKKAAMEMAYMLTTGIIITILSSMKGDDDDDDKARQYSLYFALRLNNEIGFFLTPGDVTRNPLTLGVNPMNMYKSFRSPTAGYTLIEKSLRLASQLSDPFEEYKRKSGPNKKGDNKAVAAFLKLIGKTGDTSNPSQVIDILLQQTK